MTERDTKQSPRADLPRPEAHERRPRALPASITVRGNRRRWMLGLVILAAGLTLSVCARSRREPSQTDDHTLYHDHAFKVVRIVDGDTLIIDAPDPTTGKENTRVRLWGVDTPEIAHGARKAMHFGPEATTFARRTLENRTIHVALCPDRTRGKYGRLLAYVYLGRGGPMFNEMLLEEGYAYADLRFGHPYKRRFERIEKRARKAGVGLWENVALDEMPKWKQRFERRTSD